MEKAMYPCKIMRITQGYGVGTYSHSRNFAIDEGGIDGGISNFIAPFTGVIKKIYTADANEVWLESVEPVLYADGTEDYMTIMFAHDNSVADLWVGKVINQGDIFYQEGTKGQATGNHVHFECGKGKFTGSGWYNNGGGWDIINGKAPTECLWIDDSYQILNNMGYNFRNTKELEPKYLGTPIERDESIDQVRVFDTTTVLRARNNPNGEVLGYMNSGIYNLLERKSDGDYEWFKVEENLWFAYSADWCEVLPKKEIVVEPIPEPTPVEPLPTIEELCEKLQQELVEKEEIINNLTAGVTELTNTIIDKDKEILKLKEQLANHPTLIFTTPKTDYYAIRLEEGQKLYLN